MFEPGYKRSFNDTQLDESMIEVPMRDVKKVEESVTKEIQQPTITTTTTTRNDQKLNLHIKDTSLSTLVKTASRHREAMEKNNKKAQQQKKDHKQRYGF